jgi:hypothetical protein
VKSEAAPVWEASDREFQVQDEVAARGVWPAAMALPEAELPEVVLLWEFQPPEVVSAAAWERLPPEEAYSRKGERRALYVCCRNRKLPERSQRVARRVGVSVFYAFGTVVALVSRCRSCVDSI